MASGQLPDVSQQAILHQRLNHVKYEVMEERRARLAVTHIWMTHLRGDALESLLVDGGEHLVPKSVSQSVSKQASKQVSKLQRASRTSGWPLRPTSSCHSHWTRLWRGHSGSHASHRSRTASR